MAGKGTRSGHRKGKPGSEGENPLLERYRSILLDRLTAEDLAGLQYSLKNQFDEKGNLVPAYRARFQGKLRTWLHEEVLTREIIGIEELIRDLKPADLKTRGQGRHRPSGRG